MCEKGFDYVVTRFLVGAVYENGCTELGAGHVDSHRGIYQQEITKLANVGLLDPVECTRACDRERILKITCRANGSYRHALQQAIAMLDESKLHTRFVTVFS